MLRRGEYLPLNRCDEGAGAERSAAFFEAQERYGRRVSFRTRCGHRLPCESAVEGDGVRIHLDGWSFATDEAAQTCDRTQLAHPPRTAWRTFASWDDARAWLHAGQPPEDRQSTEVGIGRTSGLQVR